MKAPWLVVGLGLALVAAPPAANAQAQQKVHRIGIILYTTPSATSHVTAAFSEALRELGHAEGKNAILEYRWAEGRPERFPALVAELVRLKMDVIVAGSKIGRASCRERV